MTLILSLMIASNHCLFEDIIGAALPAAHTCPVDGSTQPHGGACKSVITTLTKHQSIDLKVIQSFERAFFVFASVFLLVSAGYILPRPRTWNHETVQGRFSSLTHSLATAPNAPPLAA